VVRNRPPEKSAAYVMYDLVLVAVLFSTPYVAAAAIAGRVERAAIVAGIVVVFVGWAVALAVALGLTPTSYLRSFSSRT
jgi:hypothetical protein